jgi:hypothetical protein
MTIEEQIIELAGMFPNKHVAIVYKFGDSNYDIYLGTDDYPFRRGWPLEKALASMLTLKPSNEEDCVQRENSDEET